MAIDRLRILQDLLDGTEEVPNVSSRELDSRLHAYQRRAVEHLHRHPRSVLMLDMGMGKTATVLQAITEAHLPVLVIAPKRVAENVWKTEAQTWRPDLSIEVAAGGPKKRAAALASGADIVAIGRDNIADIDPKAFRTIVLDELSSFKSRGSKRWGIARRICKPAPFVWGLTGTPAPNSLLDLWPQMYLIDQGERLETSLGRYRERYFRPGHRLPTGIVTEWNLRAGSREAIHSKLSDICISMDSGDYLDLPDTTTNDVLVPMDPKTAKVYETMRKDLVAKTESGTILAANAAVATGKLSQITAGFLYPDPDDPEEGETEHLHRAKVDTVAEIVAGTGTPVLVFYRFIEERDRLIQAMPQASTMDEDSVIDRWNSGDVPVLLAHPASSGHGLNLQAGGHTIVWATLPWSLEQYLQANARLSRQGQEHPVVVHRLVTPGTVDEAIIASLEGKKTTQDALRQALEARRV